MQNKGKLRGSLRVLEGRKLSADHFSTWHPHAADPSPPASSCIHFTLHYFRIKSCACHVDLYASVVWVCVRMSECDCECECLGHVCGCSAFGILRWCRKSWMMAFAFTQPFSLPLPIPSPFDFPTSCVCVRAFGTQILLIPLICVNDCHWHCWQNCLWNPCPSACFSLDLATVSPPPATNREPFPDPVTAVTGLWPLVYGSCPWSLGAKFYERPQQLPAEVLNSVWALFKFPAGHKSWEPRISATV